jgi:hypothetical protein
VTVADALPAVADTPIGGSGFVAGTTAPVAEEGGLVPSALVAVTVNVYETPFVRPVTVAVAAVAP